MVLIALVLITLTVARLTRFIKGDQLTLGFRRWVVKRYGEDSKRAYLVHCSWCTSMWVALPGGVAWAFTMLPLRHWWLALPAALAMSYVAGLLSQVEES